MEPTRTQARPTPAPRPKRRRGRWLRILAFLLFLAALGVAAGLITARIIDDQNNGGSGNGGNGGGGGSPTEAVSTATGITDFDPFGTPDKHENPSEVAFAYDGNPNTAWHSETYVDSRKFGNAKPGVGLVVALQGTDDISAVEIDANAGYDVEIYVSDQPHDSLDGWGKPRAEGTNVPANARVELSPSAKGQYVLVWFTLLPESLRLDVSEIRVV